MTATQMTATLIIDAVFMLAIVIAIVGFLSWSIVSDRVATTRLRRVRQARRQPSVRFGEPIRV